MTPGSVKNKIVSNVFQAPSKNLLRKIVGQCSSTMLTMVKVAPILGASQKIVAAGLSRPIFLFFNRTWVRLHRRPPRALAVSTKMRPSRTKWASVATINTTPEKIKVITPTSFHEKASKRKRNANISTNINEDDLHIANEWKTRKLCMERKRWFDILKNDSVIVFSDRLDRPISRLVAIAVGTTFVLHKYVEHNAYIGVVDLPIVFWFRIILRLEFSRPKHP